MDDVWRIYGGYRKIYRGFMEDLQRIHGRFINIRAHSLTIPIFLPVACSTLRTPGQAENFLGGPQLKSTFKYAERARPFKYTNGTGVSYYLHIFKCRYVTVDLIPSNSSCFHSLPNILVRRIAKCFFSLHKRSEGFWSWGRQPGLILVPDLGREFA